MSRYDESGEDDDLPRGRRGPSTGRRRLSRKGRIIGTIAVVVTVLVAGTSLAAYAAYLGTLHSIETFSTATIGGHQPPAYDGSENILVVGSDSRGGSNKKFGANVQGQRSDTMLILHIRPNHKGAVVVSLPRDTEVPVIACSADGLGDPGQPDSPGQTEMLNATYAYGGPPCLWKTIEQQTGIRINHYLGLTFTGFEKVINDIGGVDVCLPEAIKDPKSGINLTAGRHHVMGSQALAFWRERYVGEGSDIQRIQRQQYLMAALIQEVKSGKLLTDYTKLYSVLHDTAKALTTDDGLSFGALVSLAEDLKGLTNQSVQFVTAPNGADPTDQNRVIWEQPEANKLFYAIAHDITLPKTSKGSTPSTQPTTSPGNVQVEVLNGNGQQGAAGQAASQLTNLGFKVAGSTNAPSSTYTSSVIEYASSTDMTDVNTLKAALGSIQVQVQKDPNLTPGTLDLIIGSDFSGLTTTTSNSSTSNPSSSPSPSPSSSSNLNKKYGGINGGTNICSDKGAFTGPDNPSQGT
ncbi:MAG TPA: LCP family protein [Streptosporangiaceae bacterium]|jgi:LCP family protein required for cell wall assembly